MSADSLAESTPNAQICLPKTKSSGFQRKNGFIGSPESVVRGPNSTQTNLAVFKKFWLKHSAKSAVIKL